MRCWALLVAAWLAAVPAPREIAVRIVDPLPGAPLFGSVTVSVEVTADEPIEKVEIVVDGELAGTLDDAPWRLAIDVGEENRDRLIEVSAYGRSGAIGRARRLAPRIEIDDSLAVQLQQIYVTVTGDDGRRVLDLDREDFRVLDEGRPQKLITFERGDIPFTAAILVDGSASMRGRRLDASLSGAHRFAGGMRPLDEAKVFVFSDRLLGTTPWTGDPETLAKALDSVAATGGTALFDHLYLALTLLEGRQGRRVVILLSDGWDIQSVLSAEELRGVVRRSQAMVYWVRLAGDEPGRGRLLGPERTAYAGPLRTLPVSSWRDEKSSRRLYALLEKTVAESGGRIVTVGGPADLAPAFEDILAELREQYVLGYDPDPRRNDGSWREVRVELARRGLTLRTRGGYVDR